MRADLADAIGVLSHSSRGLIRQARARYSTDLLKWRHRHAFDSIWQTVDAIPGWFHEGSAVVIYELIQAHRPKTVVEIGSYLGRSTVFFALSLKEARANGLSGANGPSGANGLSGASGRVVAIDPHTGDRQQLEGLATERLATFELFSQHCRAAGVEDLVEPRVASSLDVAAGWREPVDLLYVDGWHSYDAVLADGEAWLPHLSPDGVVVFDDYGAYDEVRQAIRDLAGRGLFRPWGAIFGQAIGGVASEPPPALRRALLLSRGGLRRSRSRL